jgi:hypothetical protein
MPITELLVISHQLPKLPPSIFPFCGWEGKEISSIDKIIHLFKPMMRVRRVVTGIILNQLILEQILISPLPIFQIPSG